MNFVMRGKSSSPSASVSSRPGFPAIPSSDLIHDSQQGHAIGREEGQEIITSPFDGEIEQHIHHAPRRQRIASGGTLPQSASDNWNQSNSSRSPGSAKLNFSYPTAVMQAPLSTHTHSRSAEQNKAEPSNNALRHLRNRSNGTVITYASSAFSNYSIATTIQPVVFDDSPKSSFSIDHYQPNGQYVAGSVNGWSKALPRARILSTSRLASENTTLYERDSSPPETLQNYKFPNAKGASQIAEMQEDTVTLPVLPTAENNRRSKRRASGKLPDMLFSRTPSTEDPTEPVSPISLQEETMATVEDASVLDPMDYISRRHSSPYADIRLSATSSVASYDAGNETLKEAGGMERPSLGYPKMSATSLMTSTSSAASNSFYGMAV